MELKMKQADGGANRSTIGFGALMITAMAAWGASWTSAKLIAGMAAAEVLVFWRFLMTFISFIPIILWSKESLRLNVKALGLTFLSAVLLIGYNEVFFAGLRYGAAGVGSLLVTTLSPMFTFLLSASLFGRKVGKKEIFGLLLGLAGGVIILDLGHLDTGDLVKSGNLLFLLGAVVWAALTITSQKAQENGVSTFVYSFYLYGFASLLDLVMALRYPVLEVFQYTPVFWWNIFYLAVFSTTFANSIFFFGSRKLGAGPTSVFMYLIPVFAVFVSWQLLHEIPKGSTLLGGILAMIAVYLVNRRQ